MGKRDGRCDVTGCVEPATVEGHWCARHGAAVGQWRCLECGEWRRAEMRDQRRHGRRLWWCAACLAAAETRDRARREDEMRRPHYSRCKLGRRWFWTVQRPWGETDWTREDESVLASGEAATEQAARTAAEAAVPGGVWWPSFCARGVYRRRVAAKRAARVTDATEGARVEFVWSRWSWLSDHDNTRQAGWTPHLIVKRSARFVFVEREAWSEDRAARQAGQSVVDLFVERRCYRLRRDELERAGETWCGPARECFYTDAGRAAFEADRERRRGVEVPAAVREAVALFGVSWPCSQADARRAFRRWSRRHHPDVGGVAEVFVAGRAVFEDLVRWLPREVA